MPAFASWPSVSRRIIRALLVQAHRNVGAQAEGWACPCQETAGPSPPFAKGGRRDVAPTDGGGGGGCERGVGVVSEEKVRTGDACGAPDNGDTPSGNAAGP